MGLADQISLRSRRRKFGLFMETMAPTAETTVLDVGVDDFAFGELSANEGRCGTLNFFEELYPWPERLTAVGQHEGERFRASYPDARYVQADALAAPVRGRDLRHRLLERGDRARGRRGRAAPLRRRGASRRPARLHHDAEPLVSGRGAHAAAARPLAAGCGLAPGVRPRSGSPGRSRTACSARARSPASSRARCGSSTSG